MWICVFKKFFLKKWYWYKEPSSHNFTEDISDSTSTEYTILLFDDYNRKINKLDSFNKKIKNLDHLFFPEAVYITFEYELKEVKKFKL